MTSAPFAVLDESRFPIVTLDTDRMLAKDVEAMIGDFEALLDRQRPFVLLTIGQARGSDRSHDDQKKWIVWLKENRQRMAQYCRAMLKVWSDGTDRDAEQKQAAAIQAMLGVPAQVLGSVDEAVAVATRLL